MGGVALRHPHRGIPAFHDVAPAAAVHMQVDEAGQHHGKE